MPNYSDGWKDAEFSCKKCGWTGKGAALASGELFRELQELDCPKCGGRITILQFPTRDEMRANRDKLSESERESLDRSDQHQAAFEQSCLRSPEQLPDIPEPSFVLMWDFAEGGATKTSLIKLGDRVLFSEVAFFEGSWRFVEVAEIIRRRYGGAVLDLMPTRGSGLYLYGDELASIERVRDARIRIFGAKPE